LLRHIAIRNRDVPEERTLNLRSAIHFGEGRPPLIAHALRTARPRRMKDQGGSAVLVIH
jgi:hypothetical protein